MADFAEQIEFGFNQWIENINKNLISIQNCSKGKSELDGLVENIKNDLRLIKAMNVEYLRYIEQLRDCNITLRESNNRLRGDAGLYTMPTKKRCQHLSIVK